VAGNFITVSPAMHMQRATGKFVFGPYFAGLSAQFQAFFNIFQQV